MERVLDQEGGSGTDDEISPLLDAVAGAVDYKGHPVLRSASGGWKSAFFIIWVEIAERFVYHGIGSNLITYLTGPLGLPVATAAETVNLWSGISMILTLLGAFLADSFLGRYPTIILASAIYVLGLGLLTFSTLLPTTNNSNSRAPKQLQIVLLYMSLYLIGIGQGGHKPCVQAFGADQFDDHSPEEAKSKSSFFNWWFFGVCAGAFLATLLVTYAEENLSWSFGFAIPLIVMLLALLVFLCGTQTYRNTVLKRSNNNVNGDGPFLRIGQVLLINCTLRNDHQTPNLRSSEVDEEARAFLSIFPIWITTFAFAIVYAQETTFFTKQGATMDRTITSTFTIPAAALASFVPLSVVVFISFYDLVFVPVARAFTGIQSGITTLQRIGTGMLISASSMAVAAVVERKRLRVVGQECGEMRFWWLVPQYVLFGLADVFTMVGLQEFLYEHVPADLKSMGLALYTTTLGIGSILSTVLVSAIHQATGSANAQTSWFSNDINKAHLDYFYFLLFGLSVFAFFLFLFLSRSHVYRR